MTTEVELAGQPCLLVRPRGARALYVLAHGAGAGMRHEFMEEISDALGARGIATLRYEFSYMRMGRARPDKPEVAEANVRAVWNAAAKRFAKLPRFAGGKSYGGRMTVRAHAAEPLAGARGLIFLGFPLHPPDKPGIERAEHLAIAPGPMLFLQGSRDEFAELALLRPVVAKLGERATLEVLEGSDHGFTRPKGAIAKLATAASAWIDRMLDS
ncbi:MAG TPA: alpha/beta family hydrolase [Kofleriaceae bacterium]|nr:alpha/beta family hydrolase [Kofleriaceae bacterium]